MKDIDVIKIKEDSKLYRTCCVCCGKDFYLSKREIEEGFDKHFCSIKCKRVFYGLNKGDLKW